MAEVLAEDVGVGRDGVRDDVTQRGECHPERGERAGVPGRPLGEGGAELVPVFGPEAARIEAQQGAVETHQAVSGVSPRARARRTSWERRVVSARATAVPKAVMR
jgi:hypothetical protein